MTFLHALILAQGEAPATTQPSGSPLGTLIPFILIGGLFYLLIIRPQRKRQSQQAALLRRVGVGDDIVTIGGFHGTVVDLDDDTIRVELSPGVVVTMARNAISKTIGEPTGLADIDEDDDDFDDLDDLDDLDFDDSSGGDGFNDADDTSS